MRLLVLIALLFLAGAAAAQEAPDFDAARTRMVRLIQIEALVIGEATGVREIDQRVLAAMGRVPRHEFVPPPLARFAYEETPLPIEVDQNLAEPFLAALMTHLLRVQPGDSVFETGTDCGYERRCWPNSAPRSTASR
jgi:protein-L-isoaspartate(D-aspartate) O-methyltransferase